MERQWLTPDGSKVSATFVRPSSEGSHVVALLKHSPGPQALRIELKRRFGLTPREAEVAELAARGLSNKEIGRELGTSAETVKIHLGRVLRKSGARGRGDLLASIAVHPTHIPRLQLLAVRYSQPHHVK